jgi:RNA polymerase sigma-70 factor (ECF subfamily)
MNDLARPQREHSTPAALPSLTRSILAHLGRHLRQEYIDPSEQKVTGELGRLLKRTTQVMRAFHEPVDKAFVDQIISLLPELRVFAISLEKDTVRAEDLVQEAALKALSQHERFERGTSLRSWLFTILKNHFLTIVRRRAREVEDATGSFAETLTFEPDQYHKLAHEELLAALEALPADQREVLLLVAVDEMSYEDAAAQMNCAVGTIKSRVNRARRHLAETMELTSADAVGWTRIRS